MAEIQEGAEDIPQGFWSFNHVILVTRDIQTEGQEVQKKPEWTYFCDLYHILEDI